MKSLRLTEGTASVYLTYLPSLTLRDKASMLIKSNVDEEKSMLVSLSDEELKEIFDWINLFLHQRSAGTLKEIDPELDY